MRRRYAEFNAQKANWTEEDKRRFRRGLKWVRPSPVDDDDEARSVKRRRRT